MSQTQIAIVTDKKVNALQGGHGNEGRLQFYLGLFLTGFGSGQSRRDTGPNNDDEHRSNEAAQAFHGQN